MAKKNTKKNTKKNKIVKKTIKKTTQITTRKPIKKVVKKVVKKPIKKPARKVTVKKKSVQKSTLQKIISKPIQKINIDYSKAVTPLGDRIVVRLTKAETMTAGGLYIPDMVQSADGYLKGVVLAVGQGHTSKKGFLKAMDVQKGDQILFSEHAGNKVIFNSEELYIVNETDVLGIIQK